MSLASNDGLGPGTREVSPVSSVSFDLFELNDPFIEMIYWFTMSHWTMQCCNSYLRWSCSWCVFVVLEHSLITCIPGCRPPMPRRWTCAANLRDLWPSSRPNRRRWSPEIIKVLLDRQPSKKCPLKKGLMRLSPCFWVPKKCSQFLPCSLNCPWEQITKTSAPKSWFLKKVLRRVGHSSKRVCYVIEWVTQKRA